MVILFSEPQPIAVHAIAAMAAIVLGGVQLYMKKGGAVHKMLGRIWLGLMLLVAVTSFFIHKIELWGLYSPIHLLSLWTIVSVGLAVYYVRIEYKPWQVMLAFTGWPSS